MCMCLLTQRPGQVLLGDSEAEACPLSAPDAVTRRAGVPRGLQRPGRVNVRVCVCVSLRTEQVSLGGFSDLGV
jgi:hypothetical protein